MELVVECQTDRWELVWNRMGTERMVERWMGLVES